MEGWKIGRVEEAEDEKTGSGRIAVVSKEGCRNRVLGNRLVASLRPLNVQQKTVSDWKPQEMVGSKKGNRRFDDCRSQPTELGFKGG